MPHRRAVIVIDPGHGGSHSMGGSSPNNCDPQTLGRVPVACG
jgi:N-acetylmuramoyl-L-alanine amidase